MDTLNEALSESLTAAADWVERVNQANGWYDEERTVGDDIALLHSEVSEMLEAYRDYGTEGAWKAVSQPGCRPIEFDTNDMPSKEEFLAHGYSIKPEGFGSEAADLFVRLLDTCRRRGVNLGEEFMGKMIFNETRPYRHGGKRL